MSDDPELRRIDTPTLLVSELMTPPPPPLGAENVKIRENSEKNQGTSGAPLQPFLGPLEQI